MKLSLAKISSERTKLLSAKTPEQYIAISINSKLPPGKKATITSEWLAKTNLRMKIFLMQEIEIHIGERKISW